MKRRKFPYWIEAKSVSRSFSKEKIISGDRWNYLSRWDGACWTARKGISGRITSSSWEHGLSRSHYRDL